MENMLTRLKNRVMTAVGSDLPALPTVNQSHQNVPTHRHLPDKFTYCRPPFLQLVTQDELKASSDHNVRPIIVPRDLSVMPWGSDAGCGYAECVNSGKSEWNEDQAFFQRQVLTHPNKLFADVPYIYFGIYDGHAGYGAALAAQMQFHFILHEKLVDTIDLLMPRIHNAATQSNPVPGGPILLEPLMFHKAVSLDELIIGALESAFHEMDAIIAGDRDKYANAGGCTACAALFICGKLYVANAGDSRATLCQRLPIKRRPNRSEEGKENLANGDGDKETPEYASFPVPFSFDHTPDTERARLMTTGKLNPNFMGGEYLAMEYAKKPLTKDLGTRILYRRETMKGWAYKTLTKEDLKMPIVTGEGKRSRLMGTIGVTRGFGDHDLRALGTGLPIKPFLSPHPEVIFKDLTRVESHPENCNEDGEYGILIMATDGLWDVCDNDTCAQIVFNTLKKYPTEKHRYVMVAQELCHYARGRVNESGHWRMSDSKAPATVDDISVLVIPVYQYYKEYRAWQVACVNKPNVEQLKLDESTTDDTDSSNNNITNNGSAALSTSSDNDDVSISEVNNDDSCNNNNDINNSSSLTKEVVATEGDAK